MTYKKIEKTIIVFVAMFLILAPLWYGSTEVAYKVEGDNVFWKIKNGLIGANCFDENGKKVIAPSRLFGQEWNYLASVEDISSKAKPISLTCYPYDIGIPMEQVATRLSLFE